MKTEKEIRKEIFNKVVELYSLRKAHENFISGETRINYAGRVYEAIITAIRFAHTKLKNELAGNKVDYSN